MLVSTIIPAGKCKSHFCTAPYPKKIKKMRIFSKALAISFHSGYNLG
jgi:hypothetical protein